MSQLEWWAGGTKDRERGDLTLGVDLDVIVGECESPVNGYGYGSVVKDPD